MPRGVRISDAAAILPLDALFYYENPKTGKKDIGPFSDLFRFKLLYERGGWWSDVDTICVADDIPSYAEAWARENPRYNSKAVGTSQLALEKGGVVAQTLYERCLQISRTNFQRREALGPALITSVIQEKGLPMDKNGSSETFFPISWIESFMLWLPDYATEVELRTQGALFMPIYQSFPQYIGLDVGWLPPSGSYLGDLCDRLSPSAVKRCSAVQVRAALRRFLERNDWARDELAACAGSRVLTDVIS